MTNDLCRRCEDTFTGRYRGALSGSPDPNSLPKLSFSIEFARGRSSLKREVEPAHCGDISVADLSLTNIHKSFGDTKVIHGVDLEVEAGEFTVFVGPSGCEKSTLLQHF